MAPDPNVQVKSFSGFNGQVDQIESIANELKTEIEKQKGLVAAAFKQDLTCFTEGNVAAPVYAPVAEVVMPYVEKVFGNGTAAAESGLNSVKTLRHKVSGIKQIDQGSAGAVQATPTPAPTSTSNVTQL